MKTYIGCKIISAEPMMKNEFERIYKHKDSTANDEDCPGYLVVYPDNYKSWSPKNVFESPYRAVTSSEIDIITSNFPSEAKEPCTLMQTKP